MHSAENDEPGQIAAGIRVRNDNDATIFYHDRKELVFVGVDKAAGPGEVADEPELWDVVNKLVSW